MIYSATLGHHKGDLKNIYIFLNIQDLERKKYCLAVPLVASSKTKLALFAFVSTFLVLLFFLRLDVTLTFAPRHSILIPDIVSSWKLKKTTTKLWKNLGYVNPQGALII